MKKTAAMLRFRNILIVILANK